MAIVLSDALPVQFWITGRPTFNETEEAGITKECFFQKFNSEDTLNIQFTDENGSVEVFDDFANEEQTEFTVPWDITGVPFVEVNGSSPNSDFLYVSYPTLNGVAYNFNFNVTFESGVDPSLQQSAVRLYIFDAGFNSLGSVIMANTIGEPLNQSGSVQITPSGNGVYVGVEYFTLDGPAIKVTLNELSVFSLYQLQIVDEDDTELALLDFESIGVIGQVSFVISDEISSNQLVKLNILDASGNILARTDYIDVKDLHDDTRFIYYTNDNNFAGIDYVTDDYPPEFGIRVESKFYTPQFPEENEGEDLGDGTVVKLSGSVKEQRLFETDPLPPYMHKKLKLVFKHNSIFIGNQAWLQEENYDLEDLDDKYAFFLGKVWLTLQDDNYVTNVF